MSPIRHPPPPERRSRSRLEKKRPSVADSWQSSLGAWLQDGKTCFRVWAPERQSVEVLVEHAGQSLPPYPLTKQKDGTFRGEMSEARAGDHYRYRLDGANTYPDPVSRFQPEGVHGPSQIVDAGQFHWTDQNWRGISQEKLIIYELHVGTFTPEGTFEAIIAKLPYLAELGVTAIELMPIGDFPGLRNWGYDGVALYAPARCYGSPDDLRRLVNAAHQQGIALLLDVVYNHLGPDGNYTSVFSPYYLSTKHQTHWGAALNFDDENSAFVRDFFIQNALHWVHEYHIDGLRLDATHAIQDDSPHHFLTELVSRVRESVRGRDIHLIAEDNRNWISLVKPEKKKGMNFSAVWSDDFHHYVRAIVAGDYEGYYTDYTDRVDDLAKTAMQGWFYQGQESRYSHGPRGTSPEGTPLDRFVFFLQNHDQIGNRALGDRLHHQISNAEYRAASALLLALPEMPLLFMGQEWAASSPFCFFTDHDEELGKAVTQGRKVEFKAFSSFSGQEIPDPQSPETFRRCKLSWTEKMRGTHKFMNAFYRALITWRQATMPQLMGECSVSAVASHALLVRQLLGGGRSQLVIIQLKGGARVDLGGYLYSHSRFRRQWTPVLTSEDPGFCSDSHPIKMYLAAPAPVIDFSRAGAVILQEQVPELEG